LVTFFAQAKKVTRSPQASGSLALGDKQEELHKELDSGFRRNDEGKEKRAARSQAKWKHCS